MTEFLGKKILFITAHPDDESFTSAGTILKNKERGGTTYIICATYGEKGRAHLSRPVHARELKAIRRRELLGVSKFLGVARIFPLGLPDGAVTEKKKTFGNKAFTIAERLRPDIIFGFGPDGITNHRDHVAASTVAMNIARRLKLPYAAFTLPPGARAAKKAFLARRHSPHYHEGIAVGRPNAKITIDGKKKKRAIAFHKSQLDRGATGLPREIEREMLRHEYFRITKPEKQP